jgi:cephalosporin-C deacetylase-like acetyl esterase
LLLASGGARTEDPPAPKPGDQMIEGYLAAETQKLSERFLGGAKTLEEWQQRRPRLREEYLYMLGLWPLPEKTPLHATITGSLERDGVIIDKLHFQSRPGLYVTGNLYRPAKASGKLPTILYVCGHSGRGRDGNKTAFQDHGLWFASNGYLCLIIDTLQLGEVAGIHHGTYREGRWWWQAAGYTPAGVECWNGVRAIDYLLGRDDVDPERLGVTGISGGGAATFWIAAADERVRCAVPVSGMSDLESYVTNKVINGHCDCMFLYNTYGWEWTTIAALVAPRPLLFANSDNDTIFPMDGNRRIIARLRELYKLYDKPELVDDYVSKGGHAYRPDLRIAVFQWLNKHLKHDTNPVKDADFKPIEGQDLRVFPEDKDLPADALNNKIDETFVPRATVQLLTEKDFAEWKKGMIRQLRERSFRSFPDRIPEPKLPTALTFEKKGAVGQVAGSVETEPNISVRIARQARNYQAKSETLFVLNPDEERADTEGWAKPFMSDTGVWEIQPRRGWTVKAPPNYVERAHVLLGQTVDEGRVWDIAAGVRCIARAEQESKPCRVVGRGQAGILAAYAALFEPAITEVVIIDPPVSHRDGPIFLNVLRVLDIPDALGLLAPTPLTLVNAKDKAFDRTAEIYKLAGAADRFQRK